MLDYVELNEKGKEMKTTLNKAELVKLNACKSGLKTFISAHGDADVKLSQALESNGWDDIWWYIKAAYPDFSQNQKNELNLLGCDWAESCLVNFESVYPDDKRPRLAIQVSRGCINGLISLDEIAAAKSAERLVAESAAKSAAWSAERLVAESAARSAARSAEESAAWLAEESAAWLAAAAWSAVRSAQKQDLMNLFLKWEGENESK